jgi:hypothetical protein
MCGLRRAAGQWTGQSYRRGSPPTSTPPSAWPCRSRQQGWQTFTVSASECVGRPILRRPLSRRVACRLLPRTLPRCRWRYADAEAHGDRSVRADGHSVSRVGIRDTAGAVDPREDPELFDIASGDRDGDRLQIGGAPDLHRAAAARTSGVRSRCGGDPSDGGLEQQCERATFLGDPNGAAGMPDLLDCEGGSSSAILALDRRFAQPEVRRWSRAGAPATQRDGDGGHLVLQAIVGRSFAPSIAARDYPTLPHAQPTVI